jgi:hypothetical protein
LKVNKSCHEIKNYQILQKKIFFIHSSFEKNWSLAFSKVFLIFGTETAIELGLASGADPEIFEGGCG